MKHFHEDITLQNHVNNYNLKTELTRLGWDGKSKVHVNLIILDGVIVGSTSTKKPALDLGAVYQKGSIIKIHNKGKIIGKGGNGGDGGSIYFDEATFKEVYTKPEDGHDGGPALKVRSKATIVNEGLIAGGGGGGGGSYAILYQNKKGLVGVGGFGGGGGAGCTHSDGGKGGSSANFSTNVIGVSGHSGVLGAGGAGGQVYHEIDSFIGDGGGLGALGKRGLGFNDHHGGDCGTPGPCVTEDYLVDWVTEGKILGVLA